VLYEMLGVDKPLREGSIHRLLSDVFDMVLTEAQKVCCGRDISHSGGIGP